MLHYRKDDATGIGDVVAGPNGVVFIQVKGAAASTARWVANVRMVEVMFLTAGVSFLGGCWGCKTISGP